MENKKSPKVTGMSEITGKVVRIRHATEADMFLIEKKMKEHNFNTVDLNYNEFVVATENGDIIAFGRLKQKCGICDIGCVVVIEEKRELNIGSLIIRHLIDYAPVNRVYAITNRVEFFRELGFKEAREGANEYFDALGLTGFECKVEGNEKPELMVYEKTRK